MCVCFFDFDFRFGEKISFVSGLEEGKILSISEILSSEFYPYGLISEEQREK